MYPNLISNYRGKNKIKSQVHFMPLGDTNTLKQSQALHNFSLLQQHSHCQWEENNPSVNHTRPLSIYLSCTLSFLKKRQLKIPGSQFVWSFVPQQSWLTHTQGMWIDPKVNALFSSLWPCQPQRSVVKWTEELWGLSEKSIELWHLPCMCAWMNVGVIAFDFWVTSLTAYSCDQFLCITWLSVCAYSCTFADSYSYLLCVSMSSHTAIIYKYCKHKHSFDQNGSKD